MVLSFTLNAQWDWVNPLPHGNHINAVDFVGNIGYSVGNGGKITWSDDIGETWEDISPEMDMDLMDVFLTNDSTVYAVGDNGIILKKVWDNAWDSLSSPVNLLLKSVVFVNQDTGFVVGYLGTILKTTNAGENWDLVVSETALTLNSVYFISEATGFIVGQNGIILKTIDVGDTWNEISVETNETLNDIYFPSNNTGYIAAGNNKILKTTDSGDSWEVIANVGSNVNFNSIYFNDDDNGIMVGQYGDVVKTVNGGLSWDPQQIPSNVTLYDITLANSGIFIYSGSFGTILKSNNSWDDFSIISSGKDINLEKTFFVDNQTGYAVGGNLFESIGLVIEITYSGDSTFVEKLKDFNEHIYDLYFINSDTGYIVGQEGKIYRTRDSGQSWDTLVSGTLSSLYSIYFINDSTGFAAGASGKIIFTDNCGHSWASFPSGTNENLFAISYIEVNIDSTIMYICGSKGTILKSYNSSPFYELDSKTSKSLYDIDFINVDSGFAVGDNGTILYTDSAGANWEKLVSGVSNPLTSVTYFNDTTSYISADGGTILKTNDNGKYWYRQNTGTTNNFKDVWFTSIDTGLVIGAGTSILRTNMGGGWEPEPDPPPGAISTNLVQDINLNVYPNPFNETLNIDFEVEGKSNVSMGIFDLSGRLVSTIYNNTQQKGQFKTSYKSDGLSNGVYLLVISIDNYYYSEKLVLIR